MALFIALMLTVGLLSVVESLEGLLDQAVGSLPSDPQAARGLALKVLEQAEVNSRPDLRARALYVLGDASLAGNDYAAAMDYLRQAQEAFQSIGDRHQEARCLRRLGDAHYFISNYDSAMGYYLSGLRIFQELADKQDEPGLRLAAGHLLVAVGNVCRADRSLPQALDYYQQALDVYQNNGFASGIAGVRANLASTYQDLGQLEAALKENLAGLEIARKLDDPYMLTILLTNAGAASIYLDQYKEARAYLDESMTINRAKNRRRGILFNLVKLGDLEMRQKNWAQAVSIYEEAVELAAQLNERSLWAEALERLAENLSHLGRPDATREAYQKAIGLRAEIMDEARKKRIQELRLVYETEPRTRIVPHEERGPEPIQIEQIAGFVGAPFGAACVDTGQPGPIQNSFGSRPESEKRGIKESIPAGFSFVLDR